MAAHRRTHQRDCHLGIRVSHRPACQCRQGCLNDQHLLFRPAHQTQLDGCEQPDSRCHRDAHHQPLHLFDISFQLSFAAVLSILLLYKPIYSLLPASVTRRKPLGWAWAMVAVSVAAQVGTTPLVCYYFGNIACYSVLSSFVAIPAATVIIYVSLSLLLSFFLLPGFSLLQGGLAYLLSLTTSATQHALQLIVMLPGACIEGIKISILQLGLIYIAIIAGCLLIQKLHRCLLHQIHLPSDSHRDYSQQECQTSPSD